MAEQTKLDKELIETAIKASHHAYAPYSGLRVGAAVLSDDGRITGGCNVENSSYGATCCAERIAIFSAVSKGARKIRRLAVFCDRPLPCLPCGICRQVMSEFACDDFFVLVVSATGQTLSYTLDQLLPERFSLN